MKRLAIFLSGSGSNAENIIRYFNNKKSAEVAIVLSNNEKAYGLERARKYNICTQAVSRADFAESDKILNLLYENKIDFIILAGFLSLIPFNITQAFKDKIINIHPSLLPKYGGKGMYGYHVHEAVVAAGETESGITIHYVNDKFDDGEIIFQAKCEVLPTDNALDVESKVRALEQEYFPHIIEQILNK